MSDPVTGPEVVAVVVTRHRAELLSTSLKVMAEQTRPPDHLVVVDNGPDQPARDIVAACPLPSTYLASQRNLGGAGGFALGMLHALALGAQWIWCGDDDGRPGDENVLETLLAEARSRGLAAVSPMVVNIDDPQRLAFPLRRGLTWKRHREELSGPDAATFLPGIASLFNGALFAASALDVVGVPDYRLFVRGDEVEIHRRLVRSGLRFGTSLRATYVHPDGSAEFKPMLGGRFHAQDPADESVSADDGHVGRDARARAGVDGHRAREGLGRADGDDPGRDHCVTGLPRGRALSWFARPVGPPAGDAPGLSGELHRTDLPPLDATNLLFIALALITTASHDRCVFTYF